MKLCAGVFCLVLVAAPSIFFFFGRQHEAGFSAPAGATVLEKDRNVKAWRVQDESGEPRALVGTIVDNEDASDQIDPCEETLAELRDKITALTEELDELHQRSDEVSTLPLVAWWRDLVEEMDGLQFFQNQYGASVQSEEVYNFLGTQLLLPWTVLQPETIDAMFGLVLDIQDLKEAQKLYTALRWEVQAVYNKERAQGKTFPEVMSGPYGARASEARDRRDGLREELEKKLMEIPEFVESPEFIANLELLGRFW